MAREKLILLHAPSVYDFRKRATLWGPIGDLVPSSTVFEMYPIGFTTMAEYLERFGHRVGIVNLAVHMLRDADFDVEECLADLHPAAFGLDLHWLPHAHGSVEVARILKRLHPTIPVIFGGFSASYFHEELIRYPQVDYILRGDSTEEPLRQLIEAIEEGAKAVDLRQIPNLTWKDPSGQPQANPLSYVPENLDGVLLDYSYVLSAVARDRSLTNYLPFARWTQYPVTAALTCRGCTRNCAICGGSAYASRHSFGRSQPAYRSPETVASDLRSIGSFSRGPIFVLGDIRQAGMEYARRFLRAMQGYEQEVMIEFFTPVDRAFMEEVAAAIPNFVVEISPESHDPAVRRYSGKPFSDAEIETSIESILAAGCQRLDLFYMSGMPGQTPQSVLETIDYCGQLLRRVDGDERLKMFISPLAPFLDPGSLAYEHPGVYGYHKFCHTLEDHRQALLAPSWKYVLSYETRWMDRSQLVDVTYEAGLRLNRIKAEYGQASAEQAQLTEERIQRAIALMTRIDRLVESTPPAQLDERLMVLRPEIEEVNNSTVCEKAELDLPTSGMPIKPLRVLGLLIEEGLERLGLRG
ncbi:MAG: TIGR04190 family B12-binding domain/radical SAM domain protein [Caldilineaceae bacterium]|nr:TIGR04190 family B12-binding domain/radical SAM domain protein [Caldilineaceae bacterium]